ncbi:15-hydroxyprostaglandin dehydrogenase [NAD(+)]-like protein [Labeo rohita]|nr:15-hydroxyprostaglandin dehydrogenase [NAD(+)] [Labeo rohita]XP_050949526.1 15-hydroxyprostaglandin dehydrogenase [NAD(+)] [Labeo rohita]RXN04760.1 15-hydroxyprostaglandin dehydrogenase [NAD(+)]-like protein [Labeo rohita]RXN28518.1 15-hydroxyprostaglandin dehydrogenase [NAD(+)]-like protein [Labeo rohita]
MDLKDKVAVVTGAAQGLGRSFVEILLKNGSKVALIDVNKSLGDELKSTLDQEYGRDRTEFFTADVTSEEDLKGALEKIVKTFGRIDILCNNAGIINEKHWEKTIAVNLGGVVRGTYLALEHMKKENGGNGGVIINISSMAGLGPLPVAPIYTATKHGVVGFSRAMAAVSKLADYGVRINILCPWFVKTSLLSSLNSEDYIERFLPLKAMSETMIQKHGCLEADVVAKAFLVLVKDESKNGDALMIDPEGAVFISFPQKAKDLPSTPVNLE